jgi:hypothetical protein
VTGLLAASFLYAGSALANSTPISAVNASVQGYGGVQVVTLRPATQAHQGVAGAQHTTTTCAELAAQNGTQSAIYKRMCTRAASAPLSATHTSGTLPFTGLQLTIAVLLGAALLGGGFLLRRVSRESSVS